ncbi:MAG TPA: peptide-methionine (S)-S-oxide reductase MsrA [Caulobacterales bacterium]|nr:peptide-methionine (S)-S-oxide reductase MsrA [Caulobacterales bacterium]
MKHWFFALSAMVLAACGASAAQPAAPHGPTAEAVFAGGCFWSMESDFEHLPGVIDAIDGYSGGHVDHPTYEQVSSETTGHYESVRVIYDTSRLSYAQLLHYYWRHIDPTDSGGQFCDRGSSYHTAIFVTPAQRAEAEASKAEAERVLGVRVATQILPLTHFWQAEDYHQNYARLHPVAYGAYRAGCRRDAVVAAVWRGR